MILGSEKSNFKKRIKFILGDIRDYDSVYKSMKNCDAVLHLAALIGIPYSYFTNRIHKDKC